MILTPDYIEIVNNREIQRSLAEKKLRMEEKKLQVEEHFKFSQVKSNDSGFSNWALNAGVFKFSSLYAQNNQDQVEKSKTYIFQGNMIEFSLPLLNKVSLKAQYIKMGASQKNCQFCVVKDDPGIFQGPQAALAIEFFRLEQFMAISMMGSAGILRGKLDHARYKMKRYSLGVGAKLTPWRLDLAIRPSLELLDITPDLDRKKLLLGFNLGFEIGFNF